MIALPEKITVLSLILIGLLCFELQGNPPAADIVFTGNLSGFPVKRTLAYIANSNPYSVWVLGGNTFASTGKKAGSITGQKKLFTELNKDFSRRFTSSGIMLAVLGEKDFEAGLHQAVSSLRALRPGYVFVLDYIGAKNNENPYLLRYIDILVNGKTLRFIGLGAWENLSPDGKTISYRKADAALFEEMEEYLKSRKKPDFTILVTCQKLKYDKELASDPRCKKLFQLILSNDPSAPLYTEEKGSVPVAGSGAKAMEIRKIFLNPVAGSVAGPPVQAWIDEKYSQKTSSITENKVKNPKKQEKKKK